MAPTSACAQFTTAPAARNLLATATPHSLSSRLHATMENVAKVMPSSEALCDRLWVSGHPALLPPPAHRTRELIQSGAKKLADNKERPERQHRSAKSAIPESDAEKFG